MRYSQIIQAEFLKRPNRFLANVLLNGAEETVHVKNTGRCRELLVPGCRVYLEKSGNPNRKTQYDLVAVEKNREGKKTCLINMDSQLPNAVVAEWIPRSGIFSENAFVRREVAYGNSRVDFFVTDGDRKAFLEVKGVTLEKDGIALFPDAPTARGIKHLGELCKAIDEGFEAYIIFVIQMKGVKRFMPNNAAQPTFGDALKNAAEHGVRIIAMDCIVTPDSMKIDCPVEIELI